MEYSAVAFVTLTEGRIVFANLEAARLLHASEASDLIGRELADWIDPSSEAELAHMLGRIGAAATQLRSCRLRMKAASDAPVELEMTLAHVFYGGKPSIMAIAREASGGCRRGKSVHGSDAGVVPVHSYGQLDRASEPTLL
ncbi:PAS domain-containing protein [Cohnella rhizosphaerae]|uniref:PAS domain-containing protein n=1 Tax=Cohnella rhizosphaerae TaxID=1457232 RepID=A0A9X4KT92_9BACL|nr:PAS domain-containing protein [Cohnella rhizosphaerae]MDG0808374.1 PAS domain-containing protein [Cohnella rhizosphaerae]